MESNFNKPKIVELMSLLTVESLKTIENKHKLENKELIETHYSDWLHMIAEYIEHYAKQGKFSAEIPLPLVNRKYRNKVYTAFIEYLDNLGYVVRKPLFKNHLKVTWTHPYIRYRRA